MSGSTPLFCKEGAIKSLPRAVLPTGRKTFASNKNVVDIKILIGPSFHSADSSLLKNFRLREGLRLQLRAESFDAFNHPNFQIPVNFLDDSEVGRVTITANEWREWQFALKLIY